jgi:aminobenzoyl-glutamate utilization protein B
VSRDAKIGSLRKSQRPDWQELVDVVMDTSIPDAWNDGIVSPGSTDVSDVSWMAPTMEFSTAAWPLGTPGHSWMNVAASAHSIGHKSLIFASKVLASAGLDLLTDTELREKAWEEHRKRTMGKVYKTPIPEGMEPPLDLWARNS